MAGEAPWGAAWLKVVSEHLTQAGARTDRTSASRLLQFVACYEREEDARRLQALGWTRVREIVNIPDREARQQVEAYALRTQEQNDLSVRNLRRHIDELVGRVPNRSRESRDPGRGAQRARLLALNRLNRRWLRECKMAWQISPRPRGDPGPEEEAEPFRRLRREAQRLLEDLQTCAGKLAKLLADLR